MSDATGPEGQIDRQIAEVLTLVDKVDENADEFASRKQTTDRSRIALIIVIVFAACLLLSLLFVFVVVLADSSRQWEKPANFMLDMLKTLVLPVVTLVLGFYFGSAKR